MLEGVTHIELWDIPGPKLDLGNGKVRVRVPHGCDVTLHVIGEKLVIIATEPNKLPESKEGAYVPRHRSDTLLGSGVAPRLVDLNESDLAEAGHPDASVKVGVAVADHHDL